MTKVNLTNAEFETCKELVKDKLLGSKINIMNTEASIEEYERRKLYADETRIKIYSSKINEYNQKMKKHIEQKEYLEALLSKFC